MDACRQLLPDALWRLATAWAVATAAEIARCAHPGPAVPGPSDGPVACCVRAINCHAPWMSALPMRADCRGNLGLLVEASYRWSMTTVRPLSRDEEALWRATMRITKALPRHLDTDLIRGTGLTASEYITLMSLSEAPKRELRMSDLASATGLSASRTTRLVDDLQSRGFVTKVASSSDARGNVARLTPRGMAKLKSAWTVHLASVRNRFFDHIDATAIGQVADALSAVAANLEDGSSAGTVKDRFRALIRGPNEVGDDAASGG